MNRCPPQFDWCITLVCDQGFLPYAMFVADQLMAVPDRKFDIVISSADDLSVLNPIPEVRFRRSEVGEFLEGLPLSLRLKQYTYWRLPVINALAKDYNRILYLDADVFITGRNIGALFNLDLRGATIAAVLDVIQRQQEKRMPREFKALGMPLAPYFNAGVLLVDGPAWRNGNCLEKLTEIGRGDPAALPCHDQSLLNILFHNDWLELSPVWNWQYSRKISMMTEHISPEIIHFSGAEKPWSEPHGAIPRRYAEIFRDYCARYGLPVPEGRYPDWTSDNLKEIRGVYLKGLQHLLRTLRYMGRFPHPLATCRHQG